MPLNVTKQTEQEIEEKVRSGGYQSADELIQEGLALIEAREAFRRAVAEGQAELDRGEYVTREESRRRMAELADRYRQRG
ncbi:MAG: type II toxin-antitoxin system ParD family antitoxin [Patescibacteria group bacterium]